MVGIFIMKSYYLPKFSVKMKVKYARSVAANFTQRNGNNPKHAI